jgi:hypothetical protein
MHWNHVKKINENDLIRAPDREGEYRAPTSVSHTSISITSSCLSLSLSLFFSLRTYSPFLVAAAHLRLGGGGERHRCSRRWRLSLGGGGGGEAMGQCSRSRRAALETADRAPCSVDDEGPCPVWRRQWGLSSTWRQWWRTRGHGRAAASTPAATRM